MQVGEENLYSQSINPILANPHSACEHRQTSNSSKKTNFTNITSPIKTPHLFTHLF